MKNIFKFITLTLLVSFITLCIILYFPFFNFETFKADRTKKYPDLSIYGVDKNYKIHINYALWSNPNLQEARYFCIASNNLGIDCQIFGFVSYNSGFEEKFYSLIFNFITKIIKPNLVIDTHPVCYFVDSPNSSSYKRYSILHSGAVEIANQDLLNHYDGYILFGDDDSWLKGYIKDKKIIKGNYIGAIKKDFIPRSRNYLINVGNNWDPKRGSDHYKKIFELLDEKNYLWVYGDRSYWPYLKNSYKRHESSSNILSDKISEAGISLIFHGHYHWKNNEPSSARIFEAAAAGNVIISDNLPIIMKMFGDSIFYIDPTKDPEIVVKEIDDIVTWVKNNPDEANIMARKSYDIFVNNYSSERTILNIIKNTQ